ncbi:aquaporin-like protein [Hypoxylon sp. FL0543]|nr:aquaporin-like protein [Hypoxylon sp. FL0543]
MLARHRSTPLPLFHKCPRHDDKTQKCGRDTINRGRRRMGLPGNIRPRPGNAHPELCMWSRIRLLLREPLLEFWGSFMMVLIGNSVVAQTYLSNREYGSWINICFGWACGVAFGIYIGGDSGAYLNPAVTFANCVFRGLPLKRFPVYVVAQLLGTFCASGVVYANYISAFDYFEGRGIRTIPPSKTSSAPIFCTFPTTFLPKASQFFSEYIANFVLMFCIFAMRDENGADLKGGGFFVMALFWLNFVLVSSFGWETGSPINPARDLTGRIWLSILGYDGAWTAFDTYSWIPIVVPFIATISGALAYDVFIYTGNSPINNPNFGLNHLWSKIRGRCGKRQADEENEGFDLSSPNEIEANGHEEQWNESERLYGQPSTHKKDTDYDEYQAWPQEPHGKQSGQGDTPQKGMSKSNNYDRKESSCSS